MKFFFKLNCVSLLYALFIFIPIELYVNILRITRLLDLKSVAAGNILGIPIVVEMIVGTVLLYLLTRKWLSGRRARFWTVILWIPYFIFFVRTFAFFFPASNPGDAPGAGAGFILMGGLIFFPFYILFLNLISTRSD